MTFSSDPVEVSGDSAAIGKTLVCDACAHHGVIAYVDPVTEAYMCESCVSTRDDAINAGAVVLAIELGHTLAQIGVGHAKAAPNTLRMARAVIDAYESKFAEEMNARTCVRCGSAASEKWWKCCPEHTTEQDPADIVCDACALELHPPDNDRSSEDDRG